TRGPRISWATRKKRGTPDSVYNSLPDGVFAGLPAEDRDGKPHDFTASAGLAGAKTIYLVGQAQCDMIVSPSHLGILNSPETRSAALQFLSSLRGRAYDFED